MLSYKVIPRILKTLTPLHIPIKTFIHTFPRFMAVFLQKSPLICIRKNIHKNARKSLRNESFAGESATNRRLKLRIRRKSFARNMKKMDKCLFITSVDWRINKHAFFAYNI